MDQGSVAREKIHYFTKTVAYIVGGRRFLGDPDGFVITPQNPWVAVKESELRDFKMANKRAFIEGLIKEIEEPSVDWETDNALTDDEIDALLKSQLKLKSKLPNITSVATVARMLERAKIQRRAESTIDLLEDRLDQLDTERVEIEDLDQTLDA